MGEDLGRKINVQKKKSQNDLLLLYIFTTNMQLFFRNPPTPSNPHHVSVC